jgi:hypothetical protein
MRPPIDELGKKPQTIDLEVTMSLRRITLISSAALLTIGSAVTPVAIAAADNAPPSHAGVVHTPRPVVTEVAPGSFTAVLAGVGTFSFKVDPVTRAVTDLVFTPAPGSALTAGAPKIRDNGLQVVLHSATAPKAAIEVEIEAEHGDDTPVVSVHREFDADHRDRDHRGDGRGGPVSNGSNGNNGGNGSNGSSGGPPTTVAPAPVSVTAPVPVTSPVPPTTTTTTTSESSNSSPGGPPSANGGNDAVDNDADGDQDRGGPTVDNDQVDNDQGDNNQGHNQGNDGDHGGSGPSGDQGGHDSHGGSGSDGPGR